MTIRVSTGARTGMLGSLGFAEQFQNGVILVYSGAQPATADAAATGTLLGTVTADAGAFTDGSPTNGLQFEAAANGQIKKLTTQNWKFNGAAAGTAGWFRLRGNAADAGALSTTLPRMDGSIATTGADLNMSNTNITVGAPHTIDQFDVTFAAS